MSFQDVVNKSKGKSPSAAGSQSESQAVAAAVFQINTAVAAFRRLVDAVGTSKDTTDLRLKLQNTRQRILQLVKDASAKLKSLSESDRASDVDKNRRVQDAKLAKDFEATLLEFQKLQKLAAERETKFTPPSSITISGSDEPSSDRESESSLTEHESQQVYLLDNEIGFNEAVIEERDQGIEEIQSQVRETNEIFKDLAVLIYEQGVTIDDIDHSIEVSAVSTTQAKLQLSKGSKSVNSKTSRCWWMVAIIAMIVLIVVVIILV